MLTFQANPEHLIAALGAAGAKRVLEEKVGERVGERDGENAGCKTFVNADLSVIGGGFLLAHWLASGHFR